jgi:hypothetical protein
MGVCDGNGVDVRSCHVASVTRGVHEFVEVAFSELCGVGFEGAWEAVAEIGGLLVEGCAGEVAHRGDGGAECPAILSVEDVQLRIAENAELKGELLADEEVADDAHSAGLCE